MGRDLFIYFKSAIISDNEISGTRLEISLSSCSIFIKNSLMCPLITSFYSS